MSTPMRELFGSSSFSGEVLAITPSFVAMLDVAPITIGHALIISRDHRKSLFDYWKSGSVELIDLAQKLERCILEKTGMASILCEHGASENSVSQAGCIDHAHVHVIPVRKNIRPSFEALGIEFKAAPQPQLKPGGLDQYIFLRDINGEAGFASSVKFPSQLVRRLVSVQQGVSVWNWRTYIDQCDRLGTRERVLASSEVYSEIAA